MVEAVKYEGWKFSFHTYEAKFYMICDTSVDTLKMDPKYYGDHRLVATNGTLVKIRSFLARFVINALPNNTAEIIEFALRS